MLVEVLFALYQMPSRCIYAVSLSFDSQFIVEQFTLHTHCAVHQPLCQQRTHSPVRWCQTSLILCVYPLQQQPISIPESSALLAVSVLAALGNLRCIRET